MKNTTFVNQWLKEKKYINLIQSRKWFELLQDIKNPKLFNELLEDTVFTYVFNENCIKEFYDQIENSNEDLLAEIDAFLKLHKDQKNNFKISDDNYKRLVIKHVWFSKDYNYAREFPDNEICRGVIDAFEKSADDDRRGFKQFKVNRNLKTTDYKTTTQKTSVAEIFKSPQEREFYIAAKNLFPNFIILPNAALSTVIDDSILKKLEKNERYLFLTTTVDCVFVDDFTFKPIYFFELDSSYHDKPDQILKDELKNRIINEAGFNLKRIRKKEQLGGIEKFKKLLQYWHEEEKPLT